MSCAYTTAIRSVLPEVAHPYVPHLCYAVSAVIAIVLVELLRAYVRSAFLKLDVNKVQVTLPQVAGNAAAPSPEVRKSDTKHIYCYDPATGEYLGKAPAMNRAEVVAAIGRAREAQREWKKTTFEQRREVLRVLNAYVIANARTICEVAARDSGKTMVDGVLGEVLTTCEKIRWTLAKGEAALRTEYRDTGLIVAHKSARVEYVPLGVVAAIVSWNYPFHNMYGPIISALFSGNAAVIKASEYVSWSAPYMGSVIREILRQMGHSPELVQIVTGGAEAGEAVVTGGVDKVTFIGSPAVGKLVMRAASTTLTPVVLELGGKDAAVICEDADFAQVENLAMRGVFQNCGQNCVGIERIVVLKPLYNKFVETMEKRVRALTQGPTHNGKGAVYDTGAMTMPSSVPAIARMVEQAVSKGARLLVGGKPKLREEAKGEIGGDFFPPTLLVDVTPDMDIAQHEVFGPVMVVMCADDDAHAVRICNNSRYGLGSSVFSTDYARAERIAAQLETGMVNVNDFGVNYLCQSLPFGGVKDSGFDRFAGVEGLRGCCLQRAITTDKVHGVRTNIPPLLQYPMPAVGFDFATSLVGMMYAPGLVARAKSLWRLSILSIFGGKGAAKAKAE